MFICLLVQADVYAVPEFVIEDIRIEGLQRITPGTVFTHLPTKVGDTFDDSRSSELVRALFKTGFFKDVKLERDGNILVFIIKERPAIGSIALNGTEDIKAEDLLDSLREIGFAEGQIFDQSQLDKLEQELRRQYFSLGKYAVELETEVTELEDNRVAVAINVNEGEVAKLKKINIVGNKAFSEKELLELFELTGPTMTSFFSGSDQYSKQRLSADLETLRSHYLDNGYVNFSIDSTQVSITPNKKEIYITINITEGEFFTITGAKLAGELILPEPELFKLVDIKSGELFSRKRLTDSSEALRQRLENEGYAFANVNAVPNINDEANTVVVTFYIDLGSRTYVRRINFSGNTKTRDEVLRREMRQQEGSWIVADKIQRGKIRLQRLGFFSEVNVETTAVPEADDQVDVHYSVAEAPSGNLSLGLGFSQTNGVTFQTSLAQNNFLGSGKRINFAFSNSDVNRRFRIGYTNPYYTIDGISRTLSVFYGETDSANANVTAFNNAVRGGSLGFGVPISEYNTFFTSISYEDIEISSSTTSALEVTDFIEANGNEYDLVRWENSLAFDTRNKAILPDSGALNRITAQIALPISNNALEFFKIDYKTQWYLSLYRDFILALKGNLGYAAGYGDTESLPFFENYYAGGPGSVRGYKENTLGPLDSSGRPLGGSTRLIGGAEVIFPLPFLKEIESVRIAGFLDSGNVYADDEDFDLGELRYSFGLSGIWVSPFGLISMSIARPIADQPGDQLQFFQFNLGASF